MTESEPTKFQFTVETEEEGSRLDAFLVSRCSDLSRTRVQADLEAGQGRVNGRDRQKGYRLQAGDRVVAP